MTGQNPEVFTDKWQTGELPKIEIGEPTDYSSMAAMGSCFARNLNRWLNFRGYTDREMPWDILYNPFAIQKEIQRVYDEGTSDLADENVIREINSKGVQLFRDPWRTWQTAETPTELQKTNRQFDDTVKRFFDGSNNMLITLGLTEVWSPEDNKDLVLNQVPIGALRAGDRRWLHRMATMAEVYNSIQTTTDLIRNNITSDGEVVYTLSPVPLKFTATNRSIREANTRSKATLAVALNESLDARDDISYFPSYEIVNALAERPNSNVWQRDGRHVGAHVVDIVAKEFLRKHGEPVGKVSQTTDLFWVPRVDENGKVVGRSYTDQTED